MPIRNPKPNLANHLSVPAEPTSRSPLWQGPEDSGDLGGITFSMLSSFLVCRERFRIKYVEGIRPIDSFNHRLEYGNMWHICEEALAKDDLRTWAKTSVDDHTNTWELALKEYAQSLCAKYKLDQEKINHWYNVCKVQFPIYISYWSKNPDVMARTPLLQEEVFYVPYKLPSGRVVHLRGKWDSVDLIDSGPSDTASLRGIWLQENKTKGDINVEQIRRQLTFDLQTMIYMIALKEWQVQYRLGGQGIPICGVRYNVVRRPLSGGKGTIKKYEPSKQRPYGETNEAFYRRVHDVIHEDQAYYFSRRKTAITDEHIEKFKRECLDPILETVCLWYDIVTGKYDSLSPKLIDLRTLPLHYRHPYGVFNPIDEGLTLEIDEYMESGSMVGLKRIDSLFDELR